MSNYNQLAVSQNPYQGNAKKALCVCSAGLLRSPSIAKFLTEIGYNTRACGATQEYALVPLTEALLLWADEIHVVSEQREVVDAAALICGQKNKYLVEKSWIVYEYNIPDQYETFAPELMKLIESEYVRIGTEIKLQQEKCHERN